MNTYKFAGGAENAPEDAREFVRLVNTLKSASLYASTFKSAMELPSVACSELFAWRGDIVAARAPGRLDVMGGIADYSGSLVLQLPVREATFVALERSDDRSIKLYSPGGDLHRNEFFAMSLNDFESGGQPVSYEHAREFFKRNPSRRWAAYAAGVFLVLMRECGVAFPGGARMLISSKVPEGKGVSSSAAIEVAAMKAVAEAYGISIEPRELAMLCQKVENLVVGAPCGAMDQMTSACGHAGQLLALRCQPAELLPPAAIPDEIAFWGLDSGVRHSVSGADYGSVRVGAFMGYRIIAELAGMKATHIGDGLVRIDDSRWKGYLANVSTTEFETLFKDQLPATIGGAEFLDRYGGTTDSVTRVQRDKSYAVRVPTAHPIYEHERVRKFAELLQAPPPADVARLMQMGKLMVQSHLSYTACGLGCDGTDRLVRLVERQGPDRGLFGAKITGGGSGGTVAVLGRKSAGDAINEVARIYEKQTGHKPYIFSGSSDGACAWRVTVG